MKKIFTLAAGIALAVSTNAQIVINEVYGGGGNSGSTYTHDFIELKNIGGTSVTLSNATLQYASTSGTFNQYHDIPTITLAPGQTYLIQEQAGNGGTTALPTPDLVAPAPTNFGSGTNTAPGFAMAAANGKIVLASNNTQVTSPTDANVLDFVGYGTANQFEGTGAAPAPSAANSIARISGDTNNNSVDFVAGSPTPQNSATLAVAEVRNNNSFLFVRNTFIKNNEINFGADAKDVKIFNMVGRVVKKASVKNNGTLDISELAKGNYIVTGTVNNKPVSQKILVD